MRGKVPRKCNTREAESADKSAGYIITTVKK